MDRIAHQPASERLALFAETATLLSIAKGLPNRRFYWNQKSKYGL